MPKIVVDSSVWIDFFNKKATTQVAHLQALILNYAWASPVIIFPVIMQEILQGVESDKYYNIIKENLQGLDYIDYEPYQLSVKSAELYRSLRRKGVTIRKVNDCLISALCIEFNLPIFHK